MINEGTKASKLVVPSFLVPLPWEGLWVGSKKFHVKFLSTKINEIETENHKNCIITV